jgi:hypothetical protein
MDHAPPQSIPTWEFLSSFHVPASRRTPDWRVFDAFNARAVQAQYPTTWKHLDPLFHLARRAADEQRRELEGALTSWNERLADLGGDPSRTDLTDFRPLRPSREEAWSDWLQHLLRASESGVLAEQLLGRIQPHADARRELVGASGKFRADLIVFWPDDTATHVEVKVGDLQFEKTWPTALDMEAKWPEIRAWRHFILLPDEDLELWRQVVPPEHGACRIDELTWSAVALGLRRTLLRRKEPLHWRVWAWTLCGVIEQRLLGMPRFGPELHHASASILSRYLDLLNRARDESPTISERK